MKKILCVLFLSIIFIIGCNPNIRDCKGTIQCIGGELVCQPNQEREKGFLFMVPCKCKCERNTVKDLQDNQ